MALDEASLKSGEDLQKFTKWKDRDFPPGTRARAKFEYLCSIGCAPRLLLSFVTLAVFNSQRQQSLYDLYGVSRSELAKLPERLEKISSELESVNQLLGHYFQAYFIENPDLPDKAQFRNRWQTNVYKRTPELLRVLAIDIRAANTQLAKRVGPKRYDCFRRSVFDLVKYVDTCTKSPHYQDVADLLDHLSSAQWKTLQGIAKWLPKPRRTGAKKKEGSTPGKLLTSPDALKALYLHWAKYGFREGRRSRSQHPTSA
jgi:hypothetical protein